MSQSTPPPTPAPPPAAPAPQEFRFVTGDFGGRSGWRAVRVTLRDGVLSLDGRGLVFRRPTFSFPLPEVINVAAAAKQLRFERQPAPGAPPIPARERAVTLHARSAEEAARLAAALPAAQSDAFAAESAKHSQFVAAYKAATRFVVVTPLMAAACVLVWVLMLTRGVDWMEPSTDALLDWGGNFWLATTGGEWWRLVTAGFLHGGVIHLAMNMQALLVCGSVIERLYGNRLYALVYAFGLLASSITSIWFEHHAVVVGASGAIFAVYGALLAYIARRRGVLSRQASQSLGTSAAVFVGYNMFFGLSHAGISNAAHLGGLAAGFALGLFISPPLERAARAPAIRRNLAIGVPAAAATIAAMALLMPRSWLDVRAEDRVMRAWDAVGAGEKSIDALYQDTLNDFDSRKITSATAVTVIESRLIPDWDAACAGILALTLPPNSSEFAELEGMKAIARLKHEWMATMAGAIRAYGDDESKSAQLQAGIEKVRELGEQLAAKAKELKALSQAKVQRAKSGK